MWALTNQTPYAAERTWVRDKNGAHSWIVAVRGTYNIAVDGKVALADKQLPPTRSAEYFGEPGTSSIKYEADLGPLKPSTDLTVHASAYAPHGRATERVLVGLQLGALQKSIVVFGERTYVRGPLGLQISRPQPFVSKPIRYEQAYGGTDRSHPDPSRHDRDPRNPVGRGFALNKRALIEQLAHSQEYANLDVTKAGPAGFGPLAGDWMPRRPYAGTYGDHWARTRKPLLPDDYDERFTLSAPHDQFVNKYLQGGERLELVGMTPSGLLRLTLPTTQLTFETRFGSKRQHHRAQLASVIAEPDDQRLSLVWQTSLPVRARDADHLDETIVGERK
jgi:hypothetical protein